jgi:tRNA-specific 2-thiouridylase
VAGAPPASAFAAQVQIRSRHAAAPARVRPLGAGRIEIEFSDTQAAITPGQAAVVFQGDEVLGGGWIDS